MVNSNPCDAATLYVTQGSGNSFKPALALAQLGIPHRLCFVDVLAGETRGAAFLAVNPMGQVPYLVDAEGHGLSESNAMLWYIADGSTLIPGDARGRADMLRWMFFEQTRLEPAISPARFYGFVVPHRAAEFGADILRWRAKATEGLTLLDAHLAGSDFVVPRHSYTIGDIAVFGYVHLAEQAGLSLAGFKHVQRWIGRVTATPGFVPIERLLDPAASQDTASAADSIAA